jgi:NAD(P)-dependent dehydrogenase (short-subunit alcohol dehydrogenase family)
MDLELAGKIVLVTGASRGIGRVNGAALVVDGGRSKAIR